MPSASDVPAAEAGPEPASTLRRGGAWLVDWVMCALVVFGLLPYDLVLDPGSQPSMFLGAPQSSWVILALFALENLLLVTLTGATVGHRLFGMQVWQVRKGTFPVQVLVRTVLLCLFVPALVTARDGRGLHDLAAGTKIVRV